MRTQQSTAETAVMKRCRACMRLSVRAAAYADRLCIRCAVTTKTTGRH